MGRMDVITRRVHPDEWLEEIEELPRRLRGARRHSRFEGAGLAEIALLAVAAGVAYAIVRQYPDIKRYLKLRSM